MIKTLGVLVLLLGGVVLFLFLSGEESLPGLNFATAGHGTSKSATRFSSAVDSSIQGRASDYLLDGPRRRDSLGKNLPFREVRTGVDWMERVDRARDGDKVAVEFFPDAEFELLVTDASGPVIMASLIGGGSRDRLVLSRTCGRVHGFLEIPSRNLAYGISGPEGGPLEVAEWLFTDIVCSTPDHNGGADKGLPRPKWIQAAAAPEAITPDQLPIINTRPGATAVIHMDFDGEVVSGSAWSSGTINAPAARLTISQVEEVMARMERDFESFEVNITTDRAVYNAAPIERRMHCIVTQDDSAYPGAGGVAYVDSFVWTNPIYKTCWVFSDTDAKTAAEAASHEVGHTLGLNHDGLVASGNLAREEYYEGHGSGETGWAPIMGVGYYRQLTQWSKGEYSRASNTQDDLSIISAATKAPYRADDRGNSTSTAATVAGSSATGFIERNTDIDVFRLEMPSGSHTLRVTPAAFTNLDARLEILNASGSVIQTADPLTTLFASATVNLTTNATIFLRITPSAKGDLLGTGYSSYASLGRYTVSGFGNQQQPPAVPTGLSLRRLSGAVIVVSWQADDAATSYEVRRNGILIGTTTSASFADTGLSPSTSYSFTVRARNSYGSSADSSSASISTLAADEFSMDGLPDFEGYLLSNPAMTIYAALRGTRLYVATWSPGDDNSGYGNDHFILLSDSLLPSATTSAPWAKAGRIAIPGNKPYLAGESASNYANWFNAPLDSILAKSPLSSGALEGSIDLVAAFGYVPQDIYIASVAYGTENGNGINSQAPGTRDDNDLGPTEFLRIPVASIRDRALNGTYDILDAARGFRVKSVSFNAQTQPVLVWDVQPGKRYFVYGSNDLATGSWSLLNTGGWNADPGQREMIFTDTEAPTGARRFYRVDW